MTLAGAVGLCFIYISLPIYLLSRIMTILFPYFIIGYVSYYNLWFELNLFELSMLGIYVLLQLIIFIFSFFVFRTHMWLWHILPGSYEMKWNSINVDSFLARMYEFYDSTQWIPITTDILAESLGNDIANIIIDYVRAIKVIDFND